MILEDKLQRRIQTALYKLGLSLEEDVAELQPVVLPSLRHLMKHLPNFQMFIYELRIKDTARIVAAITEQLHLWPVFRSIAVETDEGDPMLVILQNNERYLKCAIGTSIELQHIDNVKSLRITANHKKGEVPRGLLFRATVVKITDSETCAVTFSWNHGIMDAVSLSQWLSGFKSRLMEQSVDEMIPYSLFLEVHRSNLHSLAANEATAFHVKRLQGIGTLKTSLWPPVKALRNGDALPGHSECASERSLEAVETYTIFKHLRRRRIPMMPEFEAQYGIRPAVIVKAAIAIVNCIATKTRAAMLLQLLAGRSWPFVDDKVASELPSPYKIAGSTMASAIDIIRIDNEETVGRFLQRLKLDQKALSRFAHCPPGLPSLLSDEDQASLSASRRQIFNWLPSSFRTHRQTHQESMLKLLENRIYHVDEPRYELTWRCGLTDEDDELSVEVIQPVEIFSPPQVEGIVDQLFQVIEELCNYENFDKTVDEVIDKVSRD